MSLSLRQRRPRRARTNHEPTSKTLMWAAVVGLLLSGGLVLASKLFNGVPGRDYGRLYVNARDVGNIANHDIVRIAGVRVGQVVKRSVGDDGRPRLELQLEPGVKVPDDTKVRIRANGLLGARFIELVPGSSGRDLSRSGTIRADEDALTFGVPEALDVFDEPTRKRLADTVGGLGQGLLGQGIELNETGRRVAREVGDANAFLRTFNSQPDVNGRFVSDLARGMGVLAEHKERLGAMLAPTARAVEPLIDERAATQETLERAPAALTSAGTQLERGRRLLTAVRSLSTAAQATLADALGGLRAATKLVDEAQDPLRRTEGLLTSASRTVPPALRVTDGLDPLLKPVATGANELSPTVAMVGKYGCDVQNFATTWRSMTGFGGPGEGPAGAAMAFRLQITPPGVGEALGVPDVRSVKDPYAPPCKYKPSVYPNITKSQEGRR